MATLPSRLNYVAFIRLSCSVRSLFAFVVQGVLDLLSGAVGRNRPHRAGKEHLQP